MVSAGTRHASSSRLSGVAGGYFARPARRLIDTAMMTALRGKEIQAWCRQVRRKGLLCRSVSETWKVMPIVNARYAKSLYYGRSSSLNDTPPGVPS